MAVIMPISSPLAAPHRAATKALAQPQAAAAVDGRVRRSQRSGAAIVEALMQLVGEGVIEPTAQQVAARAKVGIRTVFRRFDDMEMLFGEMDARLQAQAVPLLLGGEVTGALSQRARALVAQRTRFYDRIAPFKRASNVKRERSPFLRARHAQLVQALRADLLRWLPELVSASSAVTDAIELATSFEAWDRLRSDQHLSRPRAQAAMEQAVHALLGCEPRLAVRPARGEKQSR